MYHMNPNRRKNPRVARPNQGMTAVGPVAFSSAPKQMDADGNTRERTMATLISPSGLADLEVPVVIFNQEPTLYPDWAVNLGADPMATMRARRNSNEMSIPGLNVLFPPGYTVDIAPKQQPLWHVPCVQLEGGHYDLKKWNKILLPLTTAPDGMYHIIVKEFDGSILQPTQPPPDLGLTAYDPRQYVYEIVQEPTLMPNGADEGLYSFVDTFLSTTGVDDKSKAINRYMVIAQTHEGMEPIAVADTLGNILPRTNPTRRMLRPRRHR